MELKRAKEVLKEFFMADVSDEQLEAHMRINFCNFGGKVDIDGKFSSDQLKAIAAWMDDPEGVVGA